MANANVIKVDERFWRSVKNKVQDWQEKTGAMVLVLYVPKPTKRNPVPTLNFEGSNKFKRMAESSCFRDMVMEACANQLPPRKTLREAMETIEMRSWNMTAKRFILSGLIRQYMELKYGIKRNIWGYSSLQPEWWPVSVPFISPNERRSVDKPLSNQNMEEVLESYVKWKSEADPPSEDPSSATIIESQDLDGLDSVESTHEGLMNTAVTGTSVIAESAADEAVDDGMAEACVTGTSSSSYVDTAVTRTSVILESAADEAVDDGMAEACVTGASAYENASCVESQVQPFDSWESNVWPSGNLERYIKRIWALRAFNESTERNVILAKTYGMKVSTRSLHAMRSCVPDEIIDTFLKVLCYRFSINNEYKHVPCAVSTMIFNSRLQHMAGNILDGPGQKLIAVVNRKSIHWVLVVMDTTNKLLTVVDPLGETKATCDNLLQLWKSYLTVQEHDTVPTWTVQNLQHPKQQDSNSCGIYCMKFAQALICGGSLSDVSTDKMVDYRSEIFRTIIHNQDEDTKELCRYCGRKNPICRNGKTPSKRIRWIGCDVCEIFWIHVECGRFNNARSKGLFVCNICA